MEAKTLKDIKTKAYFCAWILAYLKKNFPEIHSIVEKAYIKHLKELAQ